MIGALAGAPIQWAILGTVLTGFFTALGIWFKYGPDRVRAATQRKEVEAHDMERVIAEYADQLKEFRKEVHGYKNDLAKISARLADSERTSSQRSDRITNMMFIIRLLISELERLDKGSIIVRQAKAMLLQMDGSDPGKSDALNTAEHAVADAKQTVISTEKAVVEINVKEGRGDGK